MLDDLSFSCFGEEMQSVAAGTSGRVMCGWMAKARRATLAEEGTLVLLPPLTAPTMVRVAG